MTSCLQDITCFCAHKLPAAIIICIKQARQTLLEEGTRIPQDLEAEKVLKVDGFWGKRVSFFKRGKIAYELGINN